MLVYRVEHIPCKLRHGPYNAPYGCYSYKVDNEIIILHRNIPHLPSTGMSFNGRYSGFTSIENLLRWFGGSLAVLEAHGYRMAFYEVYDEGSMLIRSSDGHVLFPMEQARCVRVLSFANLCEYVPVRPSLAPCKIV